MDLVSVALGGARIGEAGARWFGGSGGWGMRFDRFEGIGFHAVLSGSAWLVGAAGEPQSLNAGDIVLIPSGAEHGLSLQPRPLRELPLMKLEAQAPPPPLSAFDIECLCGAYRLGRGHLHPFLRNLPDLIVVSPDPAQYPELSALITVLGQDISESRAGTSLTRTALIDLILVHALRAGPEPLFEIDDAGVAAALSAIHDSPQTLWTVDQLSARAGLSRTAFGRRFVAQTGTSPMAYLTTQRLTRAAQLLCDTDTLLAGIAGQVGYSSEFAFANAFRREFGVSPGRYRREHQRVLGLAL
ncbi:AraC family transcriptional regulator [Kineosporia mesophila]|uniref:AraC family transcriptional regulator n=1 Tax=Kineosporia mesophila TaxID=566012 RepID=A0ABP7AHY4_9ACTN|nr:AraC family transcriptional regulator [Kineosporia mesophila]MCD5350772.1 AraC family transcriptional regulator [Kineosporia mesophila]